MLDLETGCALLTCLCGTFEFVIRRFILIYCSFLVYHMQNAAVAFLMLLGLEIYLYIVVFSIILLLTGFLMCFFCFDILC